MSRASALLQLQSVDLEIDAHRARLDAIDAALGDNPAIRAAQHNLLAARTDLDAARVVISTERSSNRSFHSSYEPAGMVIGKAVVDMGFSATETILTTVPGGQGVRAASSTAARLHSDPSTANKILIASFIAFHVTSSRNVLL